MDDVKPKVRTHEQLPHTERRKMPHWRGSAARANKDRPAHEQASRAWTNRADERHKTKFKFHVPDWLLPKNGVHALQTFSASIVWGICGKMADVPDYETQCHSIL